MRQSVDEHIPDVKGATDMLRVICIRVIGLDSDPLKENKDVHTCELRLGRSGARLHICKV